MPHLIASVPDLLAKVEGVVDHLEHLLQHIIRGRPIDPVDCYFHHVEEHEVVDAFVVTTISRL